MNAKQRKRLLKLGDFIVERVPKKKFNMGIFGTMQGPLDVGCRSAAAGCAIGWTPTLFRRAGVDVFEGFPIYKGRQCFGVGVGLFGLTYEQTAALFSGTKSGSSAKQVRRDILRLVAKLDKEKQNV